MICRCLRLDLSYLQFSTLVSYILLLWHQKSPYGSLLCCRVMRSAHSQQWMNLCNPMDCSPSGSSVHGIFQARILDWVAISYSRWSSNPGMAPCKSLDLSCVGRQILYHYATWEAQCNTVVTQSCLTLCDPMDCSTPSASIHEILWIKVLEWVAVF